MRTPTPDPPCGCYEAVTEHIGRGAIKRNLVPLRQRAFRRPMAKTPRPTAANLLSPGPRGADVRMRLWLWCIFEAHARWMHGEDPEFEIAGRTWAERLHLLAVRGNTESNRDLAGRRVANGLRALQDRNLVEPCDGHGAWRLLAEDGRGKPYRGETAEEVERRRTSRADFPRRLGWGERSLRYDSYTRHKSKGYVVTSELWEDDPIELPAALWANGWVSALSAAALATLFALIDQEREHRRAPRRRRAPTGSFYPAKVRTSQYGIGRDVWQRGRDELSNAGVISVTAGRIVGAVERQIYTLDLDVLASERRCPVPARRGAARAR